MIDSQGETWAKLALLDLLREERGFARRGAVASELAIARQANRVDLALIFDGLHLFEIKTEADNLDRFDKQIEAYQMCGTTVSIVVASKHLNAAMSRVGDHIGVFEIVGFSADSPIRPIRAASLSPYVTVEGLLDLLPASEIRERLLYETGALRRSQAVELAKFLERDVVESALISFLLERYRTTTREFLRATRRRKSRASDINLLKVWKSDIASTYSSSEENCFRTQELDRQIFGSLSKSFGPVPAEIVELLKR